MYQSQLKSHASSPSDCFSRAIAPRTHESPQSGASEYVVSLGERISDMLLVLPDPASEISRDSDVQRSTVAGENVNVIGALCSHARGVFCNKRDSSPRSPRRRPSE